jgi:hypothetical protein
MKIKLILLILILSTMDLVNSELNEIEISEIYGFSAINKFETYHKLQKLGIICLKDFETSVVDDISIGLDPGALSRMCEQSRILYPKLMKLKKMKPEINEKSKPYYYHDYKSKQLEYLQNLEAKIIEINKKLEVDSNKVQAFPILSIGINLGGSDHQIDVTPQIDGMGYSTNGIIAAITPGELIKSHLRFCFSIQNGISMNVQDSDGDLSIMEIKENFKSVYNGWSSGLSIEAGIFSFFAVYPTKDYHLTKGPDFHKPQVGYCFKTPDLGWMKKIGKVLKKNKATLGLRKLLSLAKRKGFSWKMLFNGVQHVLGNTNRGEYFDNSISFLKEHPVKGLIAVPFAEFIHVMARLFGGNLLDEVANNEFDKMLDLDINHQSLAF